MMKCSLVSGLLAGLLLIVGCGSGSESVPAPAPTGAKTIVDAFGRTTVEDDECGGTDSWDYAEHFRHAMFRDGTSAFGRFWLVDGSHLWSLPAGTATGLATPDPHALQATWPTIVVPWIGAAHAVTAGPDYLAVAVVDRGIAILPYGDPQALYWIESRRVLDVAAWGHRLVAAAGEDGFPVWEIIPPDLPRALDPVTHWPDSFAAGVRHRIADSNLYLAACSHVGMIGSDREVVIGPLAHPAAKDADGDRDSLAWANNGAGLFILDDRRIRSLGGADPDVHANAVVVDPDSRTAYAAAGNRAIIASPLDEGRPARQAPRDPIGIHLEGRRLYAFGNFRDIGERTLMRFTVDGPDLTGETRILEPAGPLSAAPTGWPGMDAPVVSFAEGRTFAFDATDSAWLRVTDVVAAAAGRDVTAVVFVDGRLVVWPTATGTPGALELAAAVPTSQASLRAGDGWIALHSGSSPVRVWRLDGAGWTEVAAPDDATELGDLIVLHGVVLGRRTLAAMVPCDFPNPLERGGLSRRTLHDAMPLDDGGSVVWCSRGVDPHTPGRRPVGDVGTRLFRCDGVASNCRLQFEIVESAVTQWLAHPDGMWTALSDGRRTAVSEFLTFNADGREVSRRVRMGRPAHWIGAESAGWLVDADAKLSNWRRESGHWRRTAEVAGPEVPR